MPRIFKVVSLFTGAGGIDYGLESTGRFKTVLANELLEAPAKTFSAMFKAKHIKVPNLTSERISPSASDFPCIIEGSVDKLDLQHLNSIETDLVVGGPPCQDFSVVRGTPGERRGISVVRGRLYAHFVKALRVLKPRAFVFENVPGLKSANGGAAYSTILEDFRNLNLRWREVKETLGNNDGSDIVEGYELLFEDTVPMNALGVPQTRDRIMIIGVRKDLIRADTLAIRKLSLRLGNALTGNGKLTATYPLTTLEAFEGRPLPEMEFAYNNIMKEYEGVWKEVASGVASERRARVWDKLTFDIKKDYLLANRLGTPDEKLGVALDGAFDEHQALLKELGFADSPVSSLKADPSNTVRSESARVLDRMRMIPPGENHEFVRNTRWEVEGRGMSLIYRRIHPLKPSHTVVAYGGGGTWGYHYQRSRSMLTNRERARLQTFPDSFKFEGSLSQVRAMIGEAVPPLAAKRVGSALAEVLDELTVQKPVTRVA